MLGFCVVWNPLAGVLNGASVLFAIVALKMKVGYILDEAPPAVQGEASLLLVEPN